MANKTVISLDMYCDKCKKVALHCVTKIEGIDSLSIGPGLHCFCWMFSLSIDMKERTLTVIGDADPLSVANLLRTKFRCAKLLSADPVPPPEPKEEKATEENKAEEKMVEAEKPKEKATEEKKAEEEKVEAENPKDDQKEEKNKEEQKEERKEERKEENSKEEEENKEAPGGDGKNVAESTQAMWYPVCEARCYPPCSACSRKAEILWPRYNHARAPNEILYVWTEDKQDSCIIM